MPLDGIDSRSIPSVTQAINKNLLRIHQQSVIKELEEWGDAYSQIGTSKEAREASGMIEYIKGYYVVSGGYASKELTDQALEIQRWQTLKKINSALDEYHRVSKLEASEDQKSQ